MIQSRGMLWCANWTPSTSRRVRLAPHSDGEFHCRSGRPAISREESVRKHSFRKQFMSRTVTLIIQLNLHSNGFWQWIWKVFEAPSQNSELNPFENLQNNLKTDRHRWSLSNLSKIEHICILRWEKKKSQNSYVHSWCKYKKKLEITANVASTKYWHETGKYFCFEFVFNL